MLARFHTSRTWGSQPRTALTNSIKHVRCETSIQQHAAAATGGNSKLLQLQFVVVPATYCVRFLIQQTSWLCNLFVRFTSNLSLTATPQKMPERLLPLLL